MNRDRVDLVVKYALAVASQGDHGRRELGEIHLIKYVYLADLEHARRHDGQTFTEAPWRFYKFGPWSEEVWQRVKPSVADIHAIERTFTSPKFDGEGVRWHVEDDAQLLADLEKQLPWEVQRAVRLAVKDYGDDTAELLNHVYLTSPMLRAAPHEDLRFDALSQEQPRAAEPGPAQQLSEKQRRRQREAREQLREKLRERLKRERPKLIKPDPPPRYDELFEQGTKILDAEAGDAIEPEQGELEFSDEIWKSRGRNEPGIP